MLEDRHLGAKPFVIHNEVLDSCIYLHPNLQVELP